jgi:hypothetical protein
MSEDGVVLDFFGVGSALVLALSLLDLGIKAWALADAVSRPAPAFPAAGKLSKPIWLAILAVALVAVLTFASVLDLFGLVGTVAAIVYLVDVRPAVRELRRPGNGPWG